MSEKLGEGFGSETILLGKGSIYDAYLIFLSARGMLSSGEADATQPYI